MTRRLVVDLQSSRPLWRIPAGAVRAIRDALPGWDVVTVAEPATSDGDGGPGTPAAIAAARGAEAYLGFGVPSGVVAAGRSTLRWAHTATAGAGGAIPNVRGTRIVLTNSAAVHAEPMADWVLAAMLHFSRGVDQMVRAQAEGRWAKDYFTDGTRDFPELRDLRVGIFGLGGVGAAVARRAVALGMAVAGVRRRPEAPGPAGLRWVGPFSDLGRLAAESDVFVIAAPHTPETAGAVSAAVLGRLPAGAIVINVSRGSLLDDAALVAALDAGRLRGAALDVFAAEPPPAGHRFWRHPRVLLSPHVSAVSARFWERELGLILSNIRSYLAGAPLANVVDLEAGY